jgi:hypothetical protein
MKIGAVIQIAAFDCSGLKCRRLSTSLGIQPTWGLSTGAPLSLRQPIPDHQDCQNRKISALPFWGTGYYRWPHVVAIGTHET